MSDNSRPIYLQGSGRGSRGRGREGQGIKKPVGGDNSHRPGRLDNSAGRGDGRAAAYLGRPTTYSSVPDNRCGQTLSTVPKSTLNYGAALMKNGGQQLQSELPASDKFQNAAATHREAALRHLTTTSVGEYSSSEDEDEEGLNRDGILDKLKSSFAAASDYDLGRSEEFISNAMKAKANICLICIESVKRVDAIWCCVGCYSMFHIPCIQKWVKDGVYQQTALSDEHFPNREQPWFCPKCRYEYRQAECPKRYMCFCGKEEDPPTDPWLVPHSCGQVCKKNLKPECGHSCLLLCHPGPCPPCPKTVRVSCHCKKQAPQIRRCGTSEWSCHSPCLKPLACGHHRCQLSCHAGECPVCPETREHSCDCGRHAAQRPCADPLWHCEEVCGKELNCGHHQCARVCHGGECGDCPRFGSQSCPCGKTKFDLPCTEDVPACLETCGKTLECSAHRCTQRCHAGPCGACREMVRKKCRCGKRDKEVQCFKEFLCETKCGNMRDCGNHPCKRKCCDGNCPPCTATCGKTLGCHLHKCLSSCHRGPCYPCPLMVTKTCNCGNTKLSVPCGAEKFSRPPKCSRLCQKPPDCHHPARDPHHCHFGVCPPCRQTCDKELARCTHRCLAPCHEAILVQIKDSGPRVGPWEAKAETRVEIVKKPCPPCEQLVPITCLGQHETASMKCYEAIIASCHRQCGRLLPCGNHRCHLECHAVEGATDDNEAGENCEHCEEPCSRTRPDGCNHQCLEPCHSGDCSSCVQMIRMRCHCQLVVCHVECDRWTHADDRERERLRSCQSKCPKLVPCGHQCSAICHPGPCPNPKRCVEKVKVRCACRRRKGDFLCNELQSGLAKMECDEVCLAAKEKQVKDKAELEKARQEEEERRQREELEDYERKYKGMRKRKPRRQRMELDSPTFLQKYRVFFAVPLFIGLVVGFVCWLISK